MWQSSRSCPEERRTKYRLVENIRLRTTRRSSHAAAALLLLAAGQRRHLARWLFGCCARNSHSLLKQDMAITPVLIGLIGSALVCQDHADVIVIAMQVSANDPKRTFTGLSFCCLTHSYRFSLARRVRLDSPSR